MTDLAPGRTDADFNRRVPNRPFLVSAERATKILADMIEVEAGMRCARVAVDDRRAVAEGVADEGRGAHAPATERLCIGRTTERIPSVRAVAPTTFMLAMTVGAGSVGRRA